MANLTFSAGQPLNQTTVIFSANRPTSPVGRKSVTEKRIADPSSTLPKGQSYPIPSFFEYRAKPKEFDSL